MPSQDSESPEAIELRRAVSADRRMLGVGIGIFIVIVGIVGGVGYVLKTQKTQIVGQSESQIDQISRQPEESAKPAVVELQSYTVKILNGSGVTGAAGKAGETLRQQANGLELSITTGNATSQTGDTLSYRNEELSKGGIMRVVGVLYPEASVKVNENQIEDLIITLGK